MKSQKIAAVMLIVTTAVPAFSQSDILVTMNFRNDPISQVADLYGRLTESQVTVENGIYCTFTFSSSARLNRADALLLVESNLVAKGIKIERTAAGIHFRADERRFRQEPMPAGDEQAHTNTPQFEVIRPSQPPAPIKIEPPTPGDHLTPQERLKHVPREGLEAKQQQDDSQPNME